MRVEKYTALTIVCTARQASPFTSAWLGFATPTTPPQQKESAGQVKCECVIQSYRKGMLSRQAMYAASGAVSAIFLRG